MLEMSQVTFQIKKKTIVDELSLHVQSGSFYGLLGRKGSGKSTMLRLCAGLLEPASGRILVNGLEPYQRENRRARIRLIGYMGPQDGYFPRLQVMEYLEVYAHTMGLYGLSARERCMEMLQLAGLERKAEQMIEDQPPGIRRELSLLRAILHRPRLLLLDEPFERTDPSQRLVMEELLGGLAQDGTTIVMSSESLPQAAQLCREIGILEKGRIVSQGDLSVVLRQARSEAPLYIRVCSGTERAVEILHREPLVKTISRDGTHIMVRFAGGIEEEAGLLAKLTGGGVLVYSFSRGQSSLENLLEREMTGREGKR